MKIQAYIKFALFINLFILSYSLVAQNVSSELKEISGTITYLDEPVKDVNIIIENTTKGTKTDAEGYYSINAQVGDKLIFTHVGFNPIEIIVEDITKVLNLDMTENTNKLDEVIIETNPNNPENSSIGNYSRMVNTSLGSINPMLLDGTRHFSVERLATQYRTLSDALKFYYPKGLPTLNFEVDGVLHWGEPYLDMSTVRDIYYVPSYPTNKLDPLNKSVMIIRTTNSEEFRDIIAEKYRNQNYYDDNATAVEESSVVSSNPNNLIGQNGIKTITGKITYLSAPVPDVNIKIKNSNKGTKTDTQGNYSIVAKTGDMLVYSHVSYKTVEVVIEDITAVLDIEMVEKTNQLKEAVVTVRKKIDPVKEMIQRMDVDLQLPDGRTVNPLKSGFAVVHIEGDKLNPGSPSLAAALNGKYSGLQTVGLPPNDILFIRGNRATYVLDGIAYDEPPIPMEQLKDIFILKSSRTVVLVPNDAPHIKKIDRERLAEQHRNQNYYSDDAVSMENTTIETPAPFVYNKNIRMISGKVTYLGEAVGDVNIIVKNSTRGTKTDRNGNFEINAKTGEILQFSHISYQPISLVIEDVTSVLQIELTEKTNALDEVVVKAKTGEVLQRFKKSKDKIETSRGIVDPKTASYAIGFVDGNEISNLYGSVREALVGKISGYYIDPVSNKAYLRGGNSSVSNDYPVAWAVDGVFTQDEPIGLNADQIKNVQALKSLAATNKYGTLGAGGVIVIQTKAGDYSANNANSKIAEQHRNQNYYYNDAATVDLESMSANQYTDQIKALGDIQKGYQFYEQAVLYKVDDYQIHMAAATTFASYYNSPNLSTQILLGLSKKHSNDPEKLKVIAYNMQAIGEHMEAVTVYERIFKLRPSYGQSYRDLANAYIENSQFNKGWRLYINYFKLGHDATNEDIGQIIYNEMEYLYFNRANQTKIKEKFQPKSENHDAFKNDVRLVFEWNTSEAEFDLEFVSPDKRAYVFEHTLAANQELITDEKLKGYSSKEFFIEDVGTGEWLVNFTYKGNKKPEPTYLKVTSFYHWGTSSQRKQVSVYKFNTERNKFQLIHINEQQLVASN